MPRYILSREIDLDRYDVLLTKLKEELQSSSREQPFILAEKIPMTQSRHIHVIWDEWTGVEDGNRSAVILQAYRELEGEEAEDITIAVGLTPVEAAELGLLPYIIRSMRATSDAVSPDEYTRIRAEESRRTLLGAKAGELRYPTIEAAEAARQRLERLLPGAHWAVVKEVEQAV